MKNRIKVSHKGVTVYISILQTTKRGQPYTEYVISDYTSGKRVRHVRASVLEVLGAPYVQAARGFGISRARLLFRHVLPVAANPAISLLGFSLAGLLSGSLLVEVVCGWPPLEHPIQEDVEVLAALCERTEPAVLGTVLRGLARLGKVPALRAAAMELILRIEPGDNEYIARSLCELVGPGRLSPAALDESTIRGILSKLITLDELPDEALGTPTLRGVPEDAFVS